LTIRLADISYRPQPDRGSIKSLYFAAKYFAYMFCYEDLFLTQKAKTSLIRTVNHEVSNAKHLVGSNFLCPSPDYAPYTITASILHGLCWSHRILLWIPRNAGWNIWLSLPWCETLRIHRMTD